MITVTSQGFLHPWNKDKEERDPLSRRASKRLSAYIKIPGDKLVNKRKSISRIP
jgi:hypothetical protein